MKKTKSRIFTDNEIQLIYNRLEGNLKDKDGQWCRGGRPKIEEMIERWLPRRKSLELIIGEKEKNPAWKKKNKSKRR